MRPIFSLFSLAFPAVALSSRGVAYTVFEKLAAPPPRWSEIAKPVDPSTEFVLHFHIRHQSEVFHSKFLDISTPGRESYGKHLSLKQAREFLKPTAPTIDALKSWLGPKAQIDNDWVDIRLTVAEAEKLLQTRYSWFQNDNGRQILRTLEVNIPKNINGLVDLVQPTTAMLAMSKEHASTYSGLEPIPPDSIHTSADCNPRQITPACVRGLYGVGTRKPTGNWNGSVGISGYLEQWAQFRDLATFLDRYAPDLKGSNFSVQFINGGENRQLAGGSGGLNQVAEANLDTQWTVGLAAPISHTYYTTGGRPPFVPSIDTPTNTNEPYLEQLRYLLSQEKVPTVLTTSYGEPEETVPLSYRIMTCDLFKQLGARGTSVIFSSGDFGPGAGCMSNDGKNKTQFQPIYPASCPWVTSVGGTRNIPEVANELSSGGFSNTFEAPEYQKATVSSYFQNNEESWKQFTPYFNQTGRGFPDVAGPSDSLVVVLLGSLYRIGGTSAAAPVFAAFVSLLNDELLSKGKPVLGFLNPLLYKNPGAFSDIVNGKSVGCDGVNPQTGEPIPGGGIVKDGGWSAVPGWDPVTGLGTPKFGELLKLT